MMIHNIDKTEISSIGKGQVEGGVVEILERQFLLRKGEWT